jgi:hypothetical protein
MLDQLSLHGIGVHVFQFFAHLSRAPYIEVIKAPLPKVRSSRAGIGKLEGRLLGGGFGSAIQRKGDFLFEHLQSFRGIGRFRFADQQVDVLGHDYVVDEQKTESRPDLIESFEKAISCPPRAKQWPLAITAKSHKVKVPVSIVAPQRVAHGRNRTLESALRGSGQAGCGTQPPNQFAAECTARNPHP